MSQKNYKENNTIRNVINILEHQKNDEGERVNNLEYWKAIHGSEEKTIWIDGYGFTHEPYCWVIWKKPDECSRRMCFKIVPRDMDIDKVREVLNAQQWIRE